MNTHTISVIGGDRRMVFAAEILAKRGFSVKTFGLCDTPQGAIVCDRLTEALVDSKIVLLPMPMTRDGVHLYSSGKNSLEIAEILEHASNALILGGMVGKWRELGVIDYGERSDLSLQNALPTAEGALMLAISHLPCTVSGSKLSVTGFGRIGKATASLFRAAGAKITVFARREESVAVARGLGYEAAHMEELSEHAGDFRCLVNTVPALVVGGDVLSRMKKDTLLLELASPPYGIDMQAAKSLGLPVVIGGGLPGTYAPETAGIIIAETLCKILSERGILK